MMLLFNSHSGGFKKLQTSLYLRVYGTPVPLLPGVYSFCHNITANSQFLLGRNSGVTFTV